MYSKAKIDLMYARKLLRIETRGGSGKVKRKCCLCDKRDLTPHKRGNYVWAFDSLIMEHPIWVHLECWEGRK